MTTRRPLILLLAACGVAAAIAPASSAAITVGTIETLPSLPVANALEKVQAVVVAPAPEGPHGLPRAQRAPCLHLAAVVASKIRGEPRWRASPPRP